MSVSERNRSVTERNQRAAQTAASQIWGYLVVDSSASPSVGSGFAVPSAPAQRIRRARWKDGRLLLGILLVAASALAGARLLSAADDTTSVWLTKHVIPAGARIGADDLTSTRVRFTSDEAARTYFATDAELDGMFAVRQIGAGEFVPKAATAGQRDADQIEVPLAVPAGRLPADTAVGDQVEAWVVPKSTGQAVPSARRVWDRVGIVQVEAVKGVAGSSARRQVLLAVPADRAGKLPDALAEIGTGEPVLVRRGR
jgi:hypothetical protein